MKKAYRISYNRWYRDDIFEEHLEFIKKNLAAIDEVALLREYCHVGYWPLEEERAATELIRRRMAQYKEAGVKSVGINVMCTIGHGNEAWDIMPKFDMPHYTDNDGTESKSCPCYMSDEFTDYIVKRYRLYAGTKPDFMWFDDDLRELNHGVSNGCFCDSCVAKFNKENGTDYDRATLVKAISADKATEEKWSAFRYGGLKRLLILLRDTIKAVDPSIKIGFMSTMRDTLNDLAACIETEKYRPGGGFYTDSISAITYDRGLPNQLFEKTFETGRQIEAVDGIESVMDIQYEYESFPYLSFTKSNTITELEAAAAVMYGNNGIAYNIFHRDDNQRLISSIAGQSQLLDAIDCFEYKNTGVYCHTGNNAMWLNELSIPTTPTYSMAQAAFILGDEWNSFDETAIMNMLSQKIFTDGRGLEILAEKGFGRYCGGSIKNVYTNGMAERFTDHPLNGEYKGVYRDVFMTFFHREDAICHEFEPDPAAEVITMLEAINHVPYGCGMYLYKNQLGGTIVVNGYLNKDFLRSEAKRSQLINVFDYLADGKMPVRTDNGIKVAPIVRENDNHDMMILLANMWFDDTGEFECRINTERPLYVINNDGSKTPVKQETDNGCSIIRVKNISPWKYMVITNK